MKKIKETEKGFYGCYWPGEGESTASWQGKPLPYLPYAYRHPAYGQKMKADAKATVCSRKTISEGVQGSEN